MGALDALPSYHRVKIIADTQQAAARLIKDIADRQKQQTNVISYMKNRLELVHATNQAYLTLMTCFDEINLPDGALEHPLVQEFNRAMDILYIWPNVRLITRYCC